MIDITEFLDQYRNSITVRYGNGCVFVALPFFHVGSDESIALRFSQTDDGRPIITDCGTTKDHLELMDIKLETYREKLNAIKERFGIEENNGAFIMEMPTNSLNFVEMSIGYFIQAISIIANIDL